MFSKQETLKPLRDKLERLMIMLSCIKNYVTSYKVKNHVFHIFVILPVDKHTLLHHSFATLYATS